MLVFTMEISAFTSIVIEKAASEFTIQLSVALRTVRITEVAFVRLAL